MPRRHTRDEQVSPLTITPADLAKPKPQPKQPRRGLHPAHAARLKREAARSALKECAMPLCTGAPIYDDEHGRLGICYSCALDVAAHFDKLEEVPALTERMLQRRFRQMAEDRKDAEQAASRAVEAGWIYYIQIDQRIKIGYSLDVRERMRAYPPHAELLAVHPGTRTLEADMHAKFAGLLAAGREWFNIGPELKDHIDTVIEQFGKPDGRHVYKFREGTKQTIKPRRSGRPMGGNYR